MLSPPRVGFVNGGILGLLSYAACLRRMFDGSADLAAEFFVLSENLDLRDRIIRRALCASVWPDVPGIRNLDLARFRREWNSGLLARRRLLARGPERFDVLHFHAQATAYASLDLMARRPSIVSIDCTQSCVLQGAVSGIERWSFGFNLRRDGEVFRGAAAIVAASQWAASDVRRLYPDCHTPIHVLPTPVPLELFGEQWIEERRLRRNPRVQCLFVGGDFPRKGGLDVLRAWQHGEFARRGELTLLTDWPLGALPDGVRQISNVGAHTPAWVNMWRSADLFVMPTHNEAFGIVFCEAGAAGLPSIGTRLNAIPEIVEDQVTGLLVEPASTSQLAVALDRLISSAELRHAMGAAARRKIEREAGLQRHRDELTGLIANLAGRNG